MERRSRVLVAVLLTATVAAGFTVSAGAGSTGDQFTQLRVCGATTFSRSQNRCTHDERRLRLDSNRISCSVTLVAQHPGTWQARFSYAGHVDPWTRGGTVAKGTTQLAFKTNVGINMPVPGGSWRCEFSFGSATTSLGFKSAGPAGEIVDAAVCTRPDVLSFGPNNTEARCAKDDSGKPMLALHRIYCNAVFAHPATTAATIQLLGSDGTVLSTSNLTIGRPTISQGFLSIDPALVSTAGGYICRFQLADGISLDKPFQIGSPAST
jgi:hypothetical protein